MDTQSGVVASGILTKGIIFAVTAATGILVVLAFVGFGWLLVKAAKKLMKRRTDKKNVQKNERVDFVGGESPEVT